MLLALLDAHECATVDSLPPSARSRLRCERRRMLRFARCCEMRLRAAHHSAAAEGTRRIALLLGAIPSAEWHLWKGIKEAGAQPPISPRDDEDAVAIRHGG